MNHHTFLTISNLVKRRSNDSHLAWECHDGILGTVIEIPEWLVDLVALGWMSNLESGTYFTIVLYDWLRFEISTVASWMLTVWNLSVYCIIVKDDFISINNFKKDKVQMNRMGICIVIEEEHAMVRKVLGSTGMNTLTREAYPH